MKKEELNKEQVQEDYDQMKRILQKQMKFTQRHLSQ